MPGLVGGGGAGRGAAWHGEVGRGKARANTAACPSETVGSPVRERLLAEHG